MIIEPPQCPKCESYPRATILTCDYCGAEHLIEDYKGIIIHFDPLEDEEGNEVYPEDGEEERLDFHFCGCKCVVEYLNDPNTERFTEYEDRNSAIFMESKHVAQFLCLLGRG